ncbi:MAG: hypothetical protein ACQEXJ_00595 [Myxococcota bacterium]
MMRHTFTTVIALSMLALASTAHAQDTDAEPMTLGVDGVFVAPVGDWADIAGVGFGGLLRFEYRLMEPLGLTARAGYIFHLDEDQGGGVDSSTNELPILVGARYYSDIGVWGGLELGLFTIFTEIEGGGGSIDDTSTELGMVLSGGYRMGNLDFSAGLMLPEIGDATGIFASVGFNFASF